MPQNIINPGEIIFVDPVISQGTISPQELQNAISTFKWAIMPNNDAPAVPEEADAPQEADEENFVSDFKQRYLGTHVLANIGSLEDVVVYVLDAVSPAGEKPPYKNFNIGLQTKSDRSIVKSVHFKIVSPLPTSKFANLEGSACFYSRIPERQWRRGFCESTMLYTLLGEDVSKVLKDGFPNKFLNPGKTKIAQLGIPKYRSFNFLNLSSAEKLFFPKYPSYREVHHALTIKNKSFISQAFCKDFALSLSPVSKNLSLYRETSKIAEVDSTNPEIVYVKENLFYQEISDLFRRICEPRVQLARI